jgi:transposase
LNRKRGPKPGPRKLRPLAEPAAKGSSGELAKARAKIAELERKIGQQALDIDFFHKALCALDGADRQGSIAPASRKSSKS